MIHVRLGYQGVAADHDPDEACRQLLLRVQTPEWTNGKYNKFPIFSCDDMQEWMQNLELDQTNLSTTFRSRFKVYEGLSIENPSAMGMAPVEPQQYSEFIKLFASASQLGRVKLHIRDLVLQQQRLGKIIVNCNTRLERIQNESWELRKSLRTYQQYRERCFEVIESIEGNTEELQRLRALNQSIQPGPDYNGFLKEYQQERSGFPLLHNHRSYSTHVRSGRSPTSLGEGRYPSMKVRLILRHHLKFSASVPGSQDVPSKPVADPNRPGFPVFKIDESAYESLLQEERSTEREGSPLSTARLSLEDCRRTLSRGNRGSRR